MAQLTAPQQARIDQEIEHALREWGRLSDVEAAIDNWPEDEVLTFVFEWALEVERLDRLAAHAERRELTPDQQKQYRRLVTLVDQRRPIIERLIG